MTSREAKIKEFIMNYEIHVPERMVEEEFHFMCLSMKQKMRYASMGPCGKSMMEMQAEAESCMDEMKEEAFFSVKRDLVLEEIIQNQGFVVGREELEAEAEAMARRQDTTMEMVKSFFGEELSMLEKDVKIRMAEDWICRQVE